MKNRCPFSDRYNTPLRAGCIWTGALGTLAAMTLDMGQLFALWRYSAAVYATVCLLIVGRRPIAPTAGDLLVLKWGFPLLYLCTQLVYPLVWH